MTPVGQCDTASLEPTSVAPYRLRRKAEQIPRTQAWSQDGLITGRTSTHAARSVVQAHTLFLQARLRTARQGLTMSSGAPHGLALIDLAVLQAADSFYACSLSPKHLPQVPQYLQQRSDSLQHKRGGGMPGMSDGSSITARQAHPPAVIQVPAHILHRHYSASQQGPRAGAMCPTHFYLGSLDSIHAQPNDSVRKTSPMLRWNEVASSGYWSVDRQARDAGSSAGL